MVGTEKTVIYTNLVRDRSIFLESFKLWTKRLIVIAAIIQFFCFPTSENVLAVLLVIVGWMCTDFFVLNKYTISKYLFSTFIIIGYSITQFFIPIVFTLFEGKPLVYNLKYPSSVFAHSLLALFVLVAAHYVYISLYKSEFFIYLSNRIRLGLAKLSLYKPINDTQGWIIGCVGLMAMLYTFVESNHYDEMLEHKGAWGKFIEGLMIYAYAPYFLLLRPIFDPVIRITKKYNYTPIVLYTVIMIVVGLAGNSRSIFMKGITAVAITYFLGLLINVFSYRIFTPKKILLAVFFILFMSGPLADLGISMVIVRGQRYDTSPVELISRTFDIYSSKDEINLFKKIATKDFHDWDETYFENIFLARFSNLKFNDLSLEQYYKLNNVDVTLQNYSYERTMALFPQPVLNFLGVEIDKSHALQGSYGDLLYYRTKGNGSDFGGFRVGHFAGVGMASFGWWYLLILFILLVPCYFLNDLLFYKIKNSSQLICTLPALISIGSIFLFLGLLSNNIENPIALITYIVRGWPQLIILYILLYHVSRKISNIFTTK
ncbi:hypothetical protein [Spirosoma spitsbergense]|uniref:hypothetical protein n=1 Tax=Spirosoma spitsbergense TaxID=431554 RepID=UPI0012F7FCF2|nr:hypothetical protein [Spirosoma spitsbergense]